MPQEAGRMARSNPVLTSFMDELEYRCHSAELAYTALILALSERGVDGIRGTGHVRKVFFYVDAFLLQAAMITRILWPVETLSADEVAAFSEENGEVLAAIRGARGEQLRLILGDEISLLNDSRLWAYFEDQDARFEVWSLKSGNDVGLSIIITSDRATSDASTHDAVRHLDSVSMTYTFLDEPFDLSAIAAVLSWLHRRTIECMAG